jgi:hypothetical protein
MPTPIGMPESKPPEFPKPHQYPTNENPAGEHLAGERPSHENKVWLWASLAVVLACAAFGSFAYAQHQRQQLDELALTNRTLNASLAQLQDQLQSVTERLTRRIEESKPAAVVAPPPAPAPIRTVAQKSATPKPVRVEPVRDSRYETLQEQLADQQKALATTREEVDRTRADLGQTRDDLGKTREELNGKLDSTRDELNGSLGRTRDELNGSIAKTHDELVTLEKRGERNYFEFSLDRSKQFQKVGPLSVSLRKVDFKRKSYDVAMLVDDFMLQKKSVNLYEPVWINLNDRPEPVQLIVNRIDKDKITGYIAAPKYKKSELEPTAEARPLSQVSSQLPQQTQVQQ